MSEEIVENPYKGTQAVIFDMMTESTGSSIVDSGIIYGRSWERNRINGFDKWPSAWPVIEDGKLDSIGKNMFTFLSSHLRHDKTMQKKLDKYISERDEMLYVSVKNFISENGKFLEGGYTAEDDWHLLAGDFRSDSFEFDDKEYVIIQYHGGCDLRGGYTYPRVFRVIDGEDFWCDRHEAGAGCKCSWAGIYFGEITSSDGKGNATEYFPKSWKASEDDKVTCERCDGEVRFSPTC